MVVGQALWHWSNCTRFYKTQIALFFFFRFFIFICEVPVKVRVRFDTATAFQPIYSKT